MATQDTPSSAPASGGSGYERSAGTSYAQSIELDKGRREKARSFKPLRWLWPFVAKYPMWIGTFLVFLVLSNIASLTLPAIGKLVLDCGFGGNEDAMCKRAGLSDDGGGNKIFIIGIIFAFLLALISGVRSYLVNTLGQRVISDIRKSVFDKLIGLSSFYYERVRTGEVLSRLTTDTTLIETILTGSLPFALRSIVTCIGALILMFFVNWKMAFMVLAIGPLIVLPALVFGKKIKRLSRGGQDNLALSSARAGESLSAIQTVQAFTRETFEKTNYAEAIEGNYTANKRRILVRSIMISLIFTLALTAIILVIWYGSIEVKRGAMSGGDIFAFITYAYLAVAGGGMLTETWANLMRASGAAERLAEIMDEPIEINAPANPKTLSNIKGNLAFKDVDFAYPKRPDTPILSDFSLDIEHGKTIALVGPSGAGKSTIFQLLLRFYDVEAGNITIDGTPITDLDPVYLRKQISIVQQNAPLFSGTPRDNIAYGRLGASDADIIDAAKRAYAHDFIMELPDGYDTDLGERAMTLSGGQKQRVAIARAILRDAPILLLDEATSALDAHSEQAVQKAFEAMAKGRTTIVIAHRLATVKKADKIIVMEDGRIAETGTHTQLIKQGGLYAKLAKLQFNQE